MDLYTVTASAELMENYVQADFLLPQEKFLALQTEAGASLVFSIGSGGVLTLTLEEPGRGQGWHQVDLAGARLRADFGGGATVKTFGAAQTVPGPGGPATGIHLAMVVDDGTRDHLYLSLGNSDADLSWVADPVWTPVPFDAVRDDGTPAVAPSPLRIADVSISEAADREYIVVDTLRDPRRAAGLISRYFITGSAGTGPRWQVHDLAVDVQAKGSGSCLGRAARARGVDGLYTYGKAGTSAQLVYTPLYNAFNRKLPPLPSRLNLPRGRAAEAVAAARDADGTTDLFVAAGGTLHWFAATNQRDGATGVPVVRHPLLTAVRSLYAVTADGIVCVWGLNGSGEVFYVTCPLGEQARDGAWSVPLPIATGVDAVSPYLDRGYGANTFFAHTGTDFVKFVKSPTTGLWSRRPVALPPVAPRPATPIHSYTTHVQVDDARGRAAAGVEVAVSASNLTSVHINHLYHVIGPEPVRVPTDARGTLTIVELTTTLAGTRFTLEVASQPPVPVNPMDAAWQRNARYTSAAELRKARIHHRDGTSRPFVPAGTSDDDLERVAAANRSLAEAYASVAADSAPPRRAGSTPSAAAPASLPTTGFQATGIQAADLRTADLRTAGVTEGIEADIGDLFGTLESGLDAVVRLVKGPADEFWQFVVRIGDVVYRAALDCVEAVVAAATWIYQQIKILVDDAVRFLEYLFDWQDILVTHQVLRNVFLRAAGAAVEGIEDTKARVGGLFQEMRESIATWTDVPALPQNATGTLTARPAAIQPVHAPGNLGMHHLQGGCTTVSGSPWPVNPVQAVLDDLVRLFEKEGRTLVAAAEAIRADIIEPFPDLSITDVITRFLAILSETLLESAENVVVSLLDVLAHLVAGFVDLLTAKLEFPVLGWLYHDLTGEDLSLLDLICLVCAIPVTLVHKAAAGRTPFPDGDPFTRGLREASGLAEIQALFVRSGPVASKAVALGATQAGAGVPGAAAEPVLDQARLKTFGLVTGILAGVGSTALIVLTSIQRATGRADAPTPLTRARASGLASLICVSNFAYVAPNIATWVNVATSSWSDAINDAVTAISILKGIAAIPAAAFSNEALDNTFALVETLINVIWNVPVIVNIVKHEHAAFTTYQSLIPESVGNFAFNLGGILELPIALTKDEEVKGVLAGTQYTLMGTYGGCMIIAGASYGLDPSQIH